MNRRKNRTLSLLYIAFLCLMMWGIAGCAHPLEKEPEKRQEQQAYGTEQDTDGEKQPAGETEHADQDRMSIVEESAKDADVDFKALKEENADIFAWLYIPDAGIDVPVLQSTRGDDFYQNHNAEGEADADGAVYIELANLTSMCDFNTVLHGSIGIDGAGAFAGLERFREPDFFDAHEDIYLYLDGNILIYKIFAAYERENASLLCSYDFTYFAGCQEFLNDLYHTRDLRMNLREGWEGVSPYHFLITLTEEGGEDTERQFVVVAVLTQDAAGTVNRIVAE